MCFHMHVKCPFVWILLNGTTCLFVFGQDLIQDHSTSDQITMPNIMRKPASLTLMYWKIHTRSSNIKGMVPSRVPFSKQGSWEIGDGNYQSDADSLLWRNRRLAMKVHDKPKFSNMFGWGDFYSNVKTVKLNLLIKGKVVDHGNGSLGVFFRHNSTGEGNVSVSLVPSTKEVKFDLERQSVAHSKSSKTFNCRIDYERVERDSKLVLCNFNPSKTCAQVQTQSQVTWICSKPFRVICVYVSFYSTDYRLVQKICPDYKYHSQGHYLPSG